MQWKLTRPHKARSVDVEARFVWRERAGVALTLAILTLFWLVLASDASALNMNVGEVRVRNLGAYGFTATNSQLTTANGGNDHLYQMYGYIGNTSGMIAIDSTSFDIVLDITRSGDTASSSLVLNATGASALGLNAGDLEIDYAFTFFDDTSAVDDDGLSWDVALRNTTLSALDVSFYGYLDLDLEGTAGDDIVQIGSSYMQITDAGTGETFRWNAAGSGATHFQAGAWPGLRDQLDAWTTAGDLGDFSTIGTGDFSGALQFDVSIAAGSTSSLSTIVTPQPDTAIMTGLGLAGLAWVSRRQARHGSPEAGRD